MNVAHNWDSAVCTPSAGPTFLEVIAMTPTPDFAATVARLEQEHRNLLTRLEKLEKTRGSLIPAFLANVTLILTAALLVGYLGLYPPGILRLPLQARTVETDVLILHSRDGSTQARLTVDAKGMHVLDDSGKEIPAKP
jgi:hypothetical protein